MKRPSISSHFKDRKPSSIRQAQIKFSLRKDQAKVKVVNLAIGDVNLPIHPAMKRRMHSLSSSKPFSNGRVPYTSTRGLEETRNAFLKAIASLDIDVSNLFINVTDGGSSAMEIMMLGVCGPGSVRPIMLLDPTYTNYSQFSKRLNIPVITAYRKLNDSGLFEPIDINEISKTIELQSPSALIIIPYDNPTGQFLN